MNQPEMERMQAKTPQQRFVRILEQEFQYAPRVAQAVLEEAEACLLGRGERLRPGQLRVILAAYPAGAGRAVRDTPTREVIWTLAAGAEDREVLAQHGRVALRQVRLQRLLDEALEQGAIASQEDLAQALQVSVRTIKRDCAALYARGVYLPTRGNVLGLGRGQTHKAQIVGRWLRGQTYDQIALYTRHSPTSIRRYVQTFVRVVTLQQQGFPVSQIALVVAIGEPLVHEYLALYQHHDTPECRARLQAQLERLGGAAACQKGAQ